MRNRKVTNLYRQDKKGQTIEVMESSIIPYEGKGEEAIRSIQSVF